MDNIKIVELISESEIKKRVKELAQIITQQIKGRDALVVGVLNGSFIFFSDLIREINCDFKCDFIKVSSYSFSNTTGNIKISKDLSLSPQGKDIILVEDIVETGYTLNFLQNLFLVKNPKSLTTVALLQKPQKKKIDYKLDHSGFEVGNNFVVGYGLDYNNAYRHLPYIAEIQNLN